MRISHSKVNLWRKCPRAYWFSYIQGLNREFDQSPSDPRILGSTMDVAIEEGMEKAEEYYWKHYSIATNEGYTELMKIGYWLPELKRLLEDAALQVRIESKHGDDDFIGFADAVVGSTLYDIKYSNNVDTYRESDQLHVYASELPMKPERMAYVCVPKDFSRQIRPKSGRKGKKDEPGEDIQEFRRRVLKNLKEKEIQFVWVDYDQSKVDKFWDDAEKMKTDTTWEPKPSESNCKWCDFNKICKPVLVEPDDYDLPLTSSFINACDKYFGDFPVPKPKVSVRKLKPRSEIKID